MSSVLNPSLRMLAIDQRRRLRQSRIKQDMAGVTGNEQRREAGRADVIGVAITRNGSRGLFQAAQSSHLCGGSALNDGA